MNLIHAIMMVFLSERRTTNQSGDCFFSFKSSASLPFKRKFIPIGCSYIKNVDSRTKDQALSSVIALQKMSRIMRKPEFLTIQKKAQISFAGNAKLTSAFVFAKGLVQSLHYLYTQFQASSLFLRLYRLVRNPEDLFSHVMAQIVKELSLVCNARHCQLTALLVVLGMAIDPLPPPPPPPPPAGGILAIMISL